MSYNIDTSVTLSGSLRILTIHVAGIQHLDIPEDCFAADLDPYSLEPDQEIDDVNWRGEGSGHSFRDVLIAEILPLTTGSADVIFTWEGGDSFSGLRIVDGVVTEHKVVMALGDTL